MGIEVTKKTLYSHHDPMSMQGDKTCKSPWFSANINTKQSSTNILYMSLCWQTGYFEHSRGFIVILLIIGVHKLHKNKQNKSNPTCLFNINLLKFVLKVNFLWEVELCVFDLRSYKILSSKHILFTIGFSMRR